MPADSEVNDPIREAAKALSSVGAEKGGRARASVLTPTERSDIARNAVRARWEKAGKVRAGGEIEGASGELAVPADGGRRASQPDIPYSMFKGNLPVGDMELEAHVLSDGRRVLTQREVVRVLSGGRESGNLRAYLQSNPLATPDFVSGATLQFRVPGNPTIATGYEGTLLLEICEWYLEARQRGLLKRNQLKLARQAEVIVRACAKVGIIALIDEATGYQEVRDRQALQLKLQAFIADDLQDWARMFPDEFWYELARLEGVRYSPRSRPLRWGKYIMAFVYDAVDEDVGKALREKNPNPHFSQNHHQWLRDFGRAKVHDQIERVVVIMKLCKDMQDFRKSFDKVFQKSPVQLAFDEIWDRRVTA